MIKINGKWKYTEEEIVNAKNNPNFGMRGKHHTEESKRKMKSHKRSDELKENHRRDMLEYWKNFEQSGGIYPNPFLGMHHSKEHNKHMETVCRKAAITFWSDKDDEYKKMWGKNLSLKLTGKPKSKEHKRNIRISTLKYIKENCGNVSPRVGKYEKEILDKLQEIIGFSIKRGFYIDGYYLDGYCQEINLAVEVDEELHYKDKKVREKDLVRQNEIMKLLNCKFLRIRESEYLQNKLEGLNFFKTKLEEVKNG